MQKVFEVLSTLLNVDIESLKGDDGNFLPEDQIATKVADTVKESLKSAKDEQHKRGLREQDASVQKWMKAQGFEIPSGMKGTEAVEAFAAWKTEQDSSKDADPAKLSKEELLKLPVVKTLISEKLTAAEQQVAATKAEFDQYKTTQKRQSIESVGQAFIEKTLREKGAVLEVPTLGIKAEDRLKAISRLIDWTKVDLNEKNELVMIDDDGEIKKDDFGKPLKFDAHVIEVATPIVGIAKQDPSKKGAQPITKESDQGSGQSKFVFADAKEYNDYISREPDSKKRLQAMKDYAEAQAEDN